VNTGYFSVESAVSQPTCKGGDTKGGWSPETLPDIVNMTATTFLSSKEHSCPACTPNREKLPLQEQKSHGSTRLLERGFDHHDIGALGAYNGLRNLALGQQGVHGHKPALKDEVAQQVQNHRNLIGLVIDGLLGQRHAHAVRQRRQEMGARGPRLLAAPQARAIDGDGLLALLGTRRLTQEPRRPGPQLGFYDLPIYPAQAGMEGGSTGRTMRKAYCLHQVGAILAPPLGDRRLTPVATEHGTTGQGEDCHQRVALAVVITEVRELGQDLDQRTGLWYHRSSSI